LFDQAQRAQLLDEASQRIDMPGIFAHSWAMMTSASLWIGVGAGCAMIFVAIRLRRWQEEI
jgi:ABC-2 type transport system permease protein